MPQTNDPTSSYTATYDAWNRLVRLADDASRVGQAVPDDCHEVR